MTSKRVPPVTLETYVPDCDCLQPARKSTCKTTTSRYFGKNFWSCATCDSSKRCQFWRLDEDVQKDMSAVFKSKRLTQFFQFAAGARPPAPPNESAADWEEEKEEEGSKDAPSQESQLQELNMDVLKARYDHQQSQHEAVQRMLQTLKSVIERCIKQHEELLPTSPAKRRRVEDFPVVIEEENDDEDTTDAVPPISKRQKR